MLLPPSLHPVSTTVRRNVDGWMTIMDWQSLPAVIPIWCWRWWPAEWPSVVVVYLSTTCYNHLIVKASRRLSSSASSEYYVLGIRSRLFLLLLLHRSTTAGAVLCCLGSFSPHAAPLAAVVVWRPVLRAPHALYTNTASDSGSVVRRPCLCEHKRRAQGAFAQLLRGQCLGQVALLIGLIPVLLAGG